MVTVNFYSLVGCEPAEGTVIMSGLYGVQDGGGGGGGNHIWRKTPDKELLISLQL